MYILICCIFTLVLSSINTDVNSVNHVLTPFEVTDSELCNNKFSRTLITVIIINKYLKILPDGGGGRCCSETKKAYLFYNEIEHTNKHNIDVDYKCILCLIKKQNDGSDVNSYVEDKNQHKINFTIMNLINENGNNITFPPEINQNGDVMTVET